MCVERKMNLHKAMNRLLNKVNGNKVVISAVTLAREAFPDSRENMHGPRKPYPEDVLDASIFLRNFSDDDFIIQKLPHFETNYRVEVHRRNH